MEQLVDNSLIWEYARRNTSPKVPAEAKVAGAYLSSLLNSDKVISSYEVLSDIMRNGRQFTGFLSFWKDAGKVNTDVLRAITAYAMLRKDFGLFEMLFREFGFTGFIKEYENRLPMETEHITEVTDEDPLKHTDEGYQTDMDGLIGIDKFLGIGFHCFFCDDAEEGGPGSEYQTLEELGKSLLTFKVFITMCKPARIGVFLIYRRYCYIGGTADELDATGIDMDKWHSLIFGEDDIARTTDEDPLKHTDGSYVTDAIGNKEYYEMLEGMTMSEVEGLYAELEVKWDGKEMYHWGTVVEREVIPGDGYVIIRFTVIRHIVQEGNERDFVTLSEKIWGEVTIRSGDKRLPDMTFTPKPQPVQGTSDIYYLNLDLRLPYGVAG